jgi:hypothetical protein
VSTQLLVNEVSLNQFLFKKKEYLSTLVTALLNCTTPVVFARITQVRS